MKLLRVLIIAAVAAAACKPTSPPSHKMMATPDIFLSPSGRAGAVGEIVSGSGGLTAWVKYGPNPTDWQAFPGSGSSGGIADGGVTAPLSGAGSVADPLKIAAATTSAAGSMSAADKALAVALTTAPQAHALARAQALLGTTVTKCIGTEFQDGNFYDATSSAGVTQSTTLSGGIAHVTSTAVAGTVGKLTGASGVAGSQSWVDNGKTSLWYMRWRGAISSEIGTGPQGGNMTFGMRAAGGGLPLVGVGADTTISTTKFMYRVYDGSSQIAGVASTVNVDTTERVWEGWNDLTKLHFAIDETEIGTGFAVTTFVGVPMVPYAITYNGTAAAERTIEADEVWLCMVPAP